MQEDSISYVEGGTEYKEGARIYVNNCHAAIQAVSDSLRDGNECKFETFCFKPVTRNSLFTSQHHAKVGLYSKLNK